MQSVCGSRAITCLTATTIFGEIIWQTESPSSENGRIYSDLPVQIYDWDNDGKNEVLYVPPRREKESMRSAPSSFWKPIVHVPQGQLTRL